MREDDEHAELLVADEAVLGTCVDIEVDHTRRRQWLRIRDRVSVRIRNRWAGDQTVTCVISGHDRAGDELIADELVLDDGPFAVSYRGSCGYGSSFDYAG